MRTITLPSLILATAALAATGEHAIPQELKHPVMSAPNAVAQHPPELLVKMFWTCDYVATAHGILDKEVATLCMIASEELKLVKFDGDLAAMLSWWRENKGPEHEALAAKLRPTAQR